VQALAASSNLLLWQLKSPCQSATEMWGLSNMKASLRKPHEASLLMTSEAPITTYSTLYLKTRITLYSLPARLRPARCCVPMVVQDMAHTYKKPPLLFCETDRSRAPRTVTCKGARQVIVSVDAFKQASELALKKAQHIQLKINVQISLSPNLGSSSRFEPVCQLLPITPS
jgi:hypothetical protein